MGVSLVADDRLPAEEVRTRLEQEVDFFMAWRKTEVTVLSLKMSCLAPVLSLAGTVVGRSHAVPNPQLGGSRHEGVLFDYLLRHAHRPPAVLPLERSYGSAAGAKE
jgi:hypothetical protein